MSITAANETTTSSHKEGKQPTAAPPSSSDRQPPRRSSLAQAAAGGNGVIAGKNNKNNNNRNDNNHKNKRQQQHPPKKQQQQKQHRDENNVGNNSNNKSKDDNNNIIPTSGDNSKKLLVDTNLTPLNDDPRSSNPKHRITKSAQRNGAGRNTESFNPESTLVRPDLRVHVGSSHASKFTKKLKHDDVVIVPELFGPEDNWDIYYTLIDEMRAIQQQQQQGNGGDNTKNKTTKNSEWISWHEGAHLISKNPSGSPTFNKVIDRLCEYFSIRKQSIGTRFNWYRDSSDWKPFHHDSAAYNPQRAKSQNVTVGVSFGACRELAFLHATPFANNNNNNNGGGNDNEEQKCRVYFPQPNNGVFSFGRDVNIHWKHGINALSDEEQDGKGRISIILWGLVEDVIEEDGSPVLLGSDGVGPHAAGQGGSGYKNRRRGNNNNNRGGRR